MSDFPTNAFSGGGGLPLSGGTLTGPVCIPLAANQHISNVRNAGLLFGSSSAAATAGIAAFNNTLFFHTSSVIDGSIFPMQLNTSELGLASSVLIAWSSGNASSTKDLLLGRAAAATLQLGQTHATTPTTQIIKAHNVTTGTGADLCLKGGTGSVANGVVSFGVRSAIAAETITGYITIKDEGGTVRKLAVVS